MLTRSRRLVKVVYDDAHLLLNVHVLFYQRIHVLQVLVLCSENLGSIYAAIAAAGSAEKLA